MWYYLCSRLVQLLHEIVILLGQFFNLLGRVGKLGLQSRLVVIIVLLGLLLFLLGIGIRSEKAGRLGC